MKSLFDKDTLLYVDYVYFQNSNLALCGWVLDKTHSASREIKLLAGASSLDAQIHTFERIDVAQRFGVQSLENCFGFIIEATNCSGIMSDISLAWSGRKFLLEKLDFEEVDTLHEVRNQVPEYSDKLNFENSVLSNKPLVSAVASSKKSKNKDKDIQKVIELLNRIDANDAGFLHQLETNALPAMHRLWVKRITSYASPKLLSFGHLDCEPKVSIVVPLYGRYDFMQHQLAHFSGDESMRNVELIYVLDDPRLIHEVSIAAQGLFNTFEYPFKLVLSTNNRGFSGANNLGVASCTAPLLLLINSDVIPFKNNWLPDFVAQYEQLDEPAILGATLLYEDSSIQHSGMVFKPDGRHCGVRMNHHPFKGLHVDLVVHSELFKVQAVTGACMLISKTLFQSINGFDELHILGDFEDSDLCLKVHNLGGNIYCSGSTRLYHLERLSQNLVSNGDWKWKLSMANAVYQERKWSKLIDKVAM